MMYRYNEFDERRVVIYARVSTEHEAQISALSNQLEWYQQYLDHHPEWNLIDRYIDEGITGTSAEKRPGFTQMIADAKAHKFDLIITREVSRFARNTEETLHFTKMLRRIGVEVFFINDNIKTFDGDGELRLTIMASLAQDESRNGTAQLALHGNLPNAEKFLLLRHHNLSQGIYSRLFGAEKGEKLR